MSTKKILVLVPGPNARGGITNYYYSIRKELPENVIYVVRGSRSWPKKENKFREIRRFLSDNYNFVKLLIKEDVSLIQVTLPFTSTAIIRDGLFILIGKLFRKKVTIFFRGWIDDFVYNLSGIKLLFVKRILFLADSIIELSEDNIKHLRHLGYTKKIYLETTLVDRSLIEDLNFDDQFEKRRLSQKKTILFLSRLEKEKGIFLLLDVYEKIKEKFPQYELVYAGDGREESNLNKRIHDSGIQGVSLKGFVNGESKKQLFKEATIFVFLSEHEGMPNAVLEAMAFGLPVITTNVGGIASVFKDGVNGCLLNDKNKDFIAKQITDLVSDENKYKKISFTNLKEAHEKFTSNVVAKRLMAIFKETIGSN